MELDLLEGAAGTDVAFGLLTLQTQYSPIPLLVVDAGTGLKESVVNIRTSDGSMLFDNMTFHSLEMDSQSGNFVERYVHIMKQMLRTCLNSKGDHKIPTLTMSQLSYVFASIVQEFNCIPFLDKEGCIDLCANDFLRP